MTETRKARGCLVNPYSDPPQDCGAPFCGCNPAWTACIEMLLECGWKGPDELRAAPDLLSIARRWAALDAGAWHADRHTDEKAQLLADTRAAIAKATGSQS